MMSDSTVTTALPPPPGSDAAVALGCTCPVLDNAHGRGYMGRAGMYVFSLGCPLHCADTSQLTDGEVTHGH